MRARARWRPARCTHAPIVDKEDDLWVVLLQPRSQAADLVDGDGRPPGIAARTLHMQHARRRRDRVSDRGEVELARRGQLQLAVYHAKVGERPAEPVVRPATQANDLLESVIRRARDGKQLVGGAQHAEEGARDSMGARHDLDTHKCSLGAHELGIDLVERLTA